MTSWPALLIDGTGCAWYTTDPDRGVYLPGHLAPGPDTAGRQLTLDELAHRYPPLRPFGAPSVETVETVRFAVRRLIGLRPLRPRLIGTVAAALHDAATDAGPRFPVVQQGRRTIHADALAALAYHVGPAVARTPGRYDPLGREDLAAVFLDWVTGVARYTDPAPTLALLLATPVALAGGWLAVTDQPLRDSPQAPLIAWYVQSRIEAACTGPPPSPPP